MTDDGKDLDERYLGINAKAKSAETVDSVKFSVISGIPETKFDYSSLINFTATQTPWVSPSKGFVFDMCGNDKYETSEYLVIDGITMIDRDISSTDTQRRFWFPVNKGTLIKAAYTGGSGKFIPLVEEAVLDD